MGVGSINRKSPTTGRMEVSISKPEGSSATKVSHDWTDKCSWYQNSLQVTGEPMTDSGDGLTFNSVNDGWIDLTHGRLYDEYSLPDKKEPKVYIDAVEQVSGFTVDYDNGNVVFDSSPSGAVTCDYWYATDSYWCIKPDPGKILGLEHAELNFSKDVMMSGAVSFEIWVYNPADLPNKIPYQTIKYKNMKDIINAANLGQGYIPAMGGLQNDILVFPFNYATVKPLTYSSGAELRVKIDGDIPFSGEWATATFYVLSEDEI